VPCCGGSYSDAVETQPKYSDEEWGLLVGLPQSVVIAASQAESDGSRRTLAEWTAGMTAIGDGRELASELVRRVATEVVARQGDIEEGEDPPIIEFSDREAGIADVVSRAGTVHALLSAKAEEADAQAYRFWVVTIAEKVVGATKSGAILGIGGDLVTEPERRFRDDLAAVLEV
jgi:hypothetical protein